MPAFLHLLKRFRKDESGVFAVFFALLAVVLIAMSGAVVDFTSMQTARSRLQTVLDSAALALQTRIDTETASQLKTRAQTLVTQSITDPSMSATVDSLTTDTNAGKLNIQATLSVPTAFVQLVGIRTLTTHLQAEVVRGSTNLEVSVALDTTQSMSSPSSKIQGLRDATNALIDLVVKDQQPPAAPTYTKLALVPYSYGVNVGSYAASVRGPVKNPNGVAISGATWSTGSSKTITGITKASNGVVTTSGNHGFNNNDWVYISGVKGMTQVNNQAYQVTKVSSTQFKLNVSSSNWSSFQSGSAPAVIKCQVSNCDVTITTSTAHGFSDNNVVHVMNVGGLTGLNDNSYAVDSTGTNSLILLGSEAGGGGTYSANSGTLYCTDFTCPYYYFTTAAGTTDTFAVSNCVTERIGTHKYDDYAPGPGSPLPAPVGFMYPSTPSNCVSQQIVPLSTDKTTLHAVATGLSAAGSTAGHIGLAWAWYLIAPNFGYLWPTASQPAAYGGANLIKAVILMTDGQFNTQYCNGVISNDSQNINGTANMINCPSPNDDSIAQAQALCTNIKATGAPNHNTILYTVGFDIGSSSAEDVSARSFLAGCATPGKAYLANTAADLTNAFTEIAKNLSALRISK